MLIFVVIVVIAIFVIPLLIAGFAIVNTVGDATREIDGALKITRPELPKAAPTGLAGASLVREDRFGPAMRRLQAKELRPPDQRARRARAHQRAVPHQGRRAARTSSSAPTGSCSRSASPGAASGPPTIPFSRVNVAAPERLTRSSAERLGKTPKQLDYMVLTQGGPRGTLWAVFFKGGGNIQGFPNGRIWRRVS